MLLKYFVLVLVLVILLRIVIDVVVVKANDNDAPVEQVINLKYCSINLLVFIVRYVSYDIEIVCLLLFSVVILWLRKRFFFASRRMAMLQSSFLSVNIF